MSSILDDIAAGCITDPNGIRFPRALAVGDEVGVLKRAYSAYGGSVCGPEIGEALTVVAIDSKAMPGMPIATVSTSDRSDGDPQPDGKIHWYFPASSLRRIAPAGPTPPIDKLWRSIRHCPIYDICPCFVVCTAVETAGADCVCDEMCKYSARLAQTPAERLRALLAEFMLTPQFPIDAARKLCAAIRAACDAPRCEYDHCAQDVNAGIDAVLTAMLAALKGGDGIEPPDSCKDPHGPDALALLLVAVAKESGNGSE